LAEHLKITIRPTKPDDWPAIVEINDYLNSSAGESIPVTFRGLSRRPEQKPH